MENEIEMIAQLFIPENDQLCSEILIANHYYDDKHFKIYDFEKKKFLRKPFVKSWKKYVALISNEKKPLKEYKKALEKLLTSGLYETE